MKLQTSYCACLAVGWIAILTGSRCNAGGVPSAEMFQAKTIEEYQRLRGLAGGSSINETLKEEIYQLKEQQRQLEASQPLLASTYNGVPGFYHGVASGDPLPDAVILWTRYTPTTANVNITLELRMTPLVSGLDLSLQLDPNVNAQIRRVKVIVTSASDWIAKLDVTGLSSNTNYIYAFADELNNVSPIGQTKTAPDSNAEVSQLVYAVFSCANFGNGYFHAYDIASTIQDLDFWVHVGDYIVGFVLDFSNSVDEYVTLLTAFLFIFKSTNTDFIPRMHRITRSERNRFFHYGKQLTYKTIVCDMQPTMGTKVYKISGKAFSSCVQLSL